MVIDSTATVEIMVDNTWKNLAPLPVTRAYAQAVTWNNIVYVIGKLSNQFYVKFYL